MRSIWGIYRSVRENDDVVTSISSLTTKVDSQGGVLVGSNTIRVSVVLSTPTAMPLAGTLVWDSTLKVLAISDGTSFHTAGGSLSVI